MVPRTAAFPRMAALITALGLALAGCSSGQPATRSSGGAESRQESRPGAASIMGVAPFLPGPAPFDSQGAFAELQHPRPPDPLASRGLTSSGPSSSGQAPSGGVLEQAGAVSMCQHWQQLVDALGGPPEPVHAAARQVARGQAGTAPAELKLASRIMMQRISGASGRVHAKTVQEDYFLSYARLADACRAAGVPLVPNTSLVP